MSRMPDCEQCGEPSTLRYMGQDICEACAPSEEYRWTCECSLCGAYLDITEARIPLCSRCVSTSKAHARLERESSDWIGQEGASFGSK